ncbi:GpE family phage tail protein [Dickeya undicola]|uniref:GpE family phage tail protein n=1 Tax=Dickeya undicola TaxID=1577887 RepID=A0A3N0FPV6_9GAMM|nr:GpE family phage tail protein [Dickeya undicola]RNM02092.1 GpE family phage tail protein [Dickeya undicola]
MDALGMLARWWRWQPSELEALPIDELETWLDIASEQIRRENGDD